MSRARPMNIRLQTTGAPEAFADGGFEVLHAERARPEGGIARRDAEIEPLRAELDTMRGDARSIQTQLLQKTPWRHRFWPLVRGRRSA